MQAQTNTPKAARKTNKAAAPKTIGASLLAQLEEMSGAVVDPETKAAKAPKTAKAPKAAKLEDKVGLHVTAAGQAYTLKCKNSTKVEKNTNRDTWYAISGFVQQNSDGEPVTVADLVALVPKHPNFVRYAIRRGWLAANTEA